MLQNYGIVAPGNASSMVIFFAALFSNYSLNPTGSRAHFLSFIPPLVSPSSRTPQNAEMLALYRSQAAVKVPGGAGTKQAGSELKQKTNV